MQTNLQKLVIFLFYDSPVCNKKDDILPLTTALTTHFRSQFNHVIPPLIPMQCFKALIFAKIGLKLRYFCKKIAKSPSAVGSALRPPCLGRFRALPPNLQKPPTAEPVLT